MKTKGRRESKNIEDLRGTEKNKNDLQEYKRQIGAEAQKMGYITSKTPIKNQKKKRTIKDIVNSMTEDDLPKYASPESKKHLREEVAQREMKKLKKLKNMSETYPTQKRFNSQVTPGKWETKGN